MGERGLGRKKKRNKAKWVQEVREPVQALNSVQKEFLSALQKYDVVVFSAPAGCGKSFLAISEVTDWLKRGKVDKVVLTRAAVPMGRTLGMLPSSLREKFEPYLMPMLQVWWKRYGRNHYENCLSNGSLELLAPEYARGRSVDGVFICDEAQSFTPEELYTLITRVEEGGKLVLIGDPTQTDIKGEDGITWLKRFVRENPELGEFIKVVEATSDDIVRGGMCKAVVEAKEREVGSVRR